MALFLNGGGSGNKTSLAYKQFKQDIDNTKPLLYVPLAMENERYSSCLEWVSSELADLDLNKIEMVASGNEILSKNLEDYCAIFIGGGNTYKLLKELKESKNREGISAFEKIANYAQNGGNIFGGSAGEILFGKNIDSCSHTDENTVNLQDTSAFDMVFGVYLGAHYTNKNPEKTLKAEKNYFDLSYNSPVVALPEECTLYINDTRVEVIGEKDFYLFKDGKRYIKKSNISYTHQDFKELIEL